MSMDPQTVFVSLLSVPAVCPMTGMSHKVSEASHLLLSSQVWFEPPHPNSPEAS